MWLEIIPTHNSYRMRFRVHAHSSMYQPNQPISQSLPSSVPVQPVEESEEQEAVVVADGGSGDDDSAALEAPAAEASEPEPSPCDDVTGVWQRQDSDAKLVLVQVRSFSCSLNKR